MEKAGPQKPIEPGVTLVGVGHHRAILRRLARCLGKKTGGTGSAIGHSPFLEDLLGAGIAENPTPPGWGLGVFREDVVDLL
jgi:hypothetical protein